LLVLLLLAAAIPQATARADVCDTLGLPTYSVEISVPDKHYTFGERARINLKVTHRITGQPVADVWAAIIPSARSQWFVFRIDKTDERGRAHFELLLRRRELPEGWIAVQAYAWRPVVDTVCGSVSEYGEERKERAFRIHD
jgi:hypothetical protein